MRSREFDFPRDPTRGCPRFNCSIETNVLSKSLEGESVPRVDPTNLSLKLRPTLLAHFVFMNVRLNGIYITHLTSPLSLSLEAFLVSVVFALARQGQTQKNCSEGRRKFKSSPLSNRCIVVSVRTNRDANFYRDESKRNEKHKNHIASHFDKTARFFSTFHAYVRIPRCVSIERYGVMVNGISNATRNL